MTSGTTFSSRKEKLKRIPHVIAALVTLLHGYERFAHGHNSYIFFLVAGVLFLVISLFHHLLARRFPMIDILFFLCEGVLAWIIAYEYFEAGKKGLPIVYLLAGILQVAAIFVFAKRKRHTPAH